MAATRWTGKGDGISWSDPANWSAGLPAAGVNATFGAKHAGEVDLDGSSDPLTAGALIVSGGSLGLAAGILNLSPPPASSGNTFDMVLSHGADVTIAATAHIYGSNVAEIGKGTGATLTVMGTVSEEYGVVLGGTLDLSGPRAHWLSGDSGLYLQDSRFVVEGGARANTGGKLAQYPAAALQIEGNSTGLVTGSGSTVWLANTFLSDASGTSTLSVEDGGRIFCGGATIGGDGDATLTVTGTGSLFHASRGMRVGGQVPVNSKLVVEDGGTVEIGQYGLQLDGDLMLDASATFTCPSILSGGGTIEALAGDVRVSSTLELYDNYTAPFETGTTYLIADAGATLTLSGAIRSAIPNDTSKTLDAASGHIVLAHSNGKFAGTTALYGATLEIAAFQAAGTGKLDFVGGDTPATLLIDAGLAFRNPISHFGNADRIDLAGFAFDSAGMTERWVPESAGGMLVLVNAAHQHQALHFVGSDLSAASFSVSADGTGGTLLMRS